MRRILENMIFDGPARTGIRHLEIPEYKTAAGLRKAVLGQMRREFQVVPPLTLHFINSELMAANWAFSREALIAGPCSRTDRELVAAIVSQYNECPFCVEVHTSMLHGAGDDSSIAMILHGATHDERKSALADWAKASTSPDEPILASAPFGAKDKPYLIATVLAFHYTNRMVNIFLDDTPLPVTVSNKWLKDRLSRLIGFIAGRRIVSIKAEPGQSVYYNDDAILHDAFFWARKNEPIARGLATFAKAAEEAGEHSLSIGVRTVVQKAVEDWNGEHMPMGRAWIDQAILGLQEHEKPGAELALLSALASYRVDENLITAFRQHQPGDLALLNVAAWGAYLAMRRISTWIDAQNVTVLSKSEPVN